MYEAGQTDDTQTDHQQLGPMQYLLISLDTSSSSLNEIALIQTRRFERRGTNNFWSRLVTTECALSMWQDRFRRILGSVTAWRHSTAFNSAHNSAKRKN